ncbi:hypothetical protein TVAG_493140 [Trichomonas vaginalis G3]|uniref:Sulfatase N-terminal domain-containing protein n=1 Tax=Trichomonas vaginalis (strain ATCC PRA-98 / G3) TaxID=412133 RepID=A2F2C2_TRIV3|nr:lipoteichoic acid synthase family [Trichomonas vaginalis G3]EAY00941.1 hypothetical protein TVAG_493140 [Trichomonas vaginalis G3]KAI5552770.1 lipoteichoic acid synthase family [Trichomonas vaginalis G3]|eukprot:XP_001313870.1 hypothetical protein [Trichomonas vaginalis G3]
MFWIIKPKLQLKSNLMLQYLDEFESVVFSFISALIIGFQKNVYQVSGTIHFDELETMLKQTDYASKSEVVYSFLTSYYLPCFFPSLLLILMYFKYRGTGFIIYKTKIYFRFSAKAIIFAHIFAIFFGFVKLIKPDEESSIEFFDKFYVNPTDELLTFPSKKKNIIFISVESLETSFFSKSIGGLFNNSYEPNIEKLYSDPKTVYFSSEKGKIGGAEQLKRARFTVSANFALTCSLPFKWMSKSSQITVENSPQYYYPKVSCIGDILQRNGYSTNSIFGTHYNDWNFGSIFDYHGIERVITNQHIINKTLVFIPDFYLFEYIRNRVMDIIKQEEPFYLHIVTRDTHEPGYICNACPEAPTKLERIYRCLDSNIEDFLRWSKKQSWYPNTVFVLHGDHLLRNNDLSALAIQNNYTRTIFNMFLHTSTKVQHKKPRKFTHLDILPTVLAAAGVEIKGNRLGLGSNLFSDTKTILEQRNKEEIEKDLEGVYAWYKNKFEDMNCNLNEPCLKIGLNFSENAFPFENN